MNDELKPCPFCGAKGSDVVVFQDVDSTFPYAVYCWGCGGGGKNCITEKEAVAAWNRRTP